MPRHFPARSPRLVTALCVGLLPLLVGGPAKSQPDKEKPDGARLERQRQAVLASRRPYRPPPTISRRDEEKKEATASLDVKIAENWIDDVTAPNSLVRHRVKTRTYNDGLVGGLIRVRPGDLLRVRL